MFYVGNRSMMIDKRLFDILNRNNQNLKLNTHTLQNINIFALNLVKIPHSIIKKT